MGLRKRRNGEEDFFFFSRLHRFSENRAHAVPGGVGPGRETHQRETRTRGRPRRNSFRASAPWGNRLRASLLLVAVLLSAPSSHFQVARALAGHTPHCATLPCGRPLRLDRLQLSGGAADEGPTPLTKHDLAAAEGPHVVPPVLADDSDDTDTQSDATAADPPSSDSLIAGAQGGATSAPREWTADEMQSVRDEYMERLFTDPHVPMVPLTNDGSISKHIMQPGERAGTTPTCGQRVFFHYDLFYEDATIASSRVLHGIHQAAPSLLVAPISAQAGDAHARGRHVEKNDTEGAGRSAASAGEISVDAEGGGRDIDGARAQDWGHQETDPGGRGGGGDQEREAWEIILSNMTRGERAMLLINNQRHQHELLLPQFISAARTLFCNRTTTRALGLKPLRLVLEVSPYFLFSGFALPLSEFVKPPQKRRSREAHSCM